MGLVSYFSVDFIWFFFNVQGIFEPPPHLWLRCQTVKVIYRINHRETALLRGKFLGWERWDSLREPCHAVGTSPRRVTPEQSEVPYGELRAGEVRRGFGPGAHGAAWLGWRMQLVRSSLPVHPLDNPIYIPFSSPGSCCYHGNYVHSCISLASGKTPFCLSPLFLAPFPAWTQSCGCQRMGKLAGLRLTGMKAGGVGGIQQDR